MSDRILVTAALPYANGSIHIGHLVEYCQADIYVRALKRLGENAIYICANDAHGTPIELNANKLGVTPEALVQRIHAEHRQDFARFDVAFDHYSITHSPTNKKVVETAYQKLRDGGFLEDREVDGIWCEHDQRFLPDRFIRGTCPACGATDQYGDVCEACGATYTTAEVKDPRCALCGNAPVLKKSTHVFFKLSSEENRRFLTEWIDAGALQSDVGNYVRNWIEGGLRDWCISRDGPYFGFSIPDRPGKYFYVWLDAPFGYVSSAMEWGELHGQGFDSLWRSENTRIEHFIGKDIVYFHTLFWPAVLNAVQYSLPAKVHVHGMLTVDGEKMSKSRGTFINAGVFADHVEPQALRYYYACKYTAQTDDLDLSLEDFVMRVNSELVNKHANLFSRAGQFLISRLDGRLGDLPFAAKEAQEPVQENDETMLGLARQVVQHCRRAEDFYRRREFSHVVRELALVADIANEFMQSRKPWDELKDDPEQARTTCTFALNICHALAMYLWPIVPRFAEAGARMLGSTIDRIDHSTLFAERERPVGAFERMFERIDKKAVEAIVQASRTEDSAAQAAKGAAKGEPSKKPAQSAPKSPATEALAPIDFKTFGQVELRVGEILSAEKVAKSDKLLRLMVNVGEAAPRQIVAGLAKAYEAESLVGTKVVVVANLAPARIMGVESKGMVLAGGEGSALSVLRLDRDLPPGARLS